MLDVELVLRGHDAVVQKGEAPSIPIQSIIAEEERLGRRVDADVAWAVYTAARGVGNIFLQREVAVDGGMRFVECVMCRANRTVSIDEMGNSRMYRTDALGKADLVAVARHVNAAAVPLLRGVLVLSRSPRSLEHIECGAHGYAGIQSNYPQGHVGREGVGSSACACARVSRRDEFT